LAALFIPLVEHFSFCFSSGLKQKYVFAARPTNPPPLHSILKSPGYNKLSLYVVIRVFEINISSTPLSAFVFDE